MQEGMFFTSESNGAVQCELCNHFCHIAHGKRGYCGVRENRKGKLYSLVYGRIIAASDDPIEKKPLFHFLPGSRTYSISTIGCNFRCLHCQNHSISQFPNKHNGGIDGKQTRPESVVKNAQLANCASISYTYVEPTIFYEFAHDVSMQAHTKQLKNVFVSNGYMAPDVTRHLSTVLDGINIDIKSFSDNFYRKICKAKLQPVLDNVHLLYELGVWIELTTLVIPGLNDSREELTDIARFIADIAPDIPWHVTRFHPTYKMNGPPSTSIDILKKARDIGLEQGLQYVYVGNLPEEGGENTYCPSCRSELIGRNRYSITMNRLVAGDCPFCGKKIKGIWAQ